MPNIYVRSTDGSDADDGSTWALAKATLTGAASIDAAGDTIFVSQAHSETSATTVTLTLAGTLASPTKLICGNDAAEPPTAVATNAVVQTTGASNISLQVAACYVEGIDFKVGSASSQASVLVSSTTDAAVVEFNKCLFSMTNTSVNSSAAFGGSGSNLDATIRLNNCEFMFGSALQSAIISNGFLEINGGGVKAGGTSPTVAFKLAGASTALAMISGFDFSNCAAGVNLTGATGGAGKAILRNCKLPESWSGALGTFTAGYNNRVEMHNCANSTKTYRLWAEDYSGTTKDESVVVCTGGANDGAAYSLKMQTSANAEYPLIKLITPDLPPVWNTAVGSAKTVTVEIVTDSVTPLNDDEVWLEVSYLSTTGQVLSAIARDCKATVLSTAVAQTTSTASWTTTGLTNPLKQKLEVTFTPNVAGFIQAHVCMAKPSTAIYVDNKLTVA